MTDRSKEKDFLRVASITGSHGLGGRLRIYMHTHVAQRFLPGKTVYLFEKGVYREYRVREFHDADPTKPFIALDGVTDRTGADQLKGCEIFIPLDEAEKSRDAVLDDDSWYYYDLIGCTVYIDDKEFGQVIDIMEGGAGDILVIKDGSGTEFMVPFVESMVDSSAVADKKLVVTPVEGLFDR